MTSITPARLRSLVSVIEKHSGPDGCWLWRGGLNSDGYPSFHRTQAHRVAYEWFVGAIPDGYELDHLCRTRDCVNPHHLEPVTASENRLRIRRNGPWLLRRYCRRGHVLAGGNARVWSNGKGEREVRCYECHRANDGSGVELETVARVKHA